MEAPTFLEQATGLFTKVLEMGTQFAEWCIATEPVNYFIMLGLLIAVIGIVRSLVRR